MNEIVRRNAMPISTMADLIALGESLAQGQICGVANPADGLVVALTCSMENMNPIEFGRKYHIIGGRPTMKPAAMAAEFRLKGGKIKKTERSATRAAAIFTFEGESEEYEFTITDAHRADLTNGKNVNWNKYPQNMLWARMMSNALDVVCPEIRYGIYTPEEMEDIMIEEQTVPQSPQSVDPVAAAKVVHAEVVEEVAVDYSLVPFELDDGQGGKVPPNTTKWDIFSPSPFLDKVGVDGAGYPNILQGHIDYVRSLLH